MTGDGDGGVSLERHTVRTPLWLLVEMVLPLVQSEMALGGWPGEARVAASGLLMMLDGDARQQCAHDGVACGASPRTAPQRFEAGKRAAAIGHMGVAVLLHERLHIHSGALALEAHLFQPLDLLQRGAGDPCSAGPCVG
jgi:hypothetical protein